MKVNVTFDNKNNLLSTYPKYKDKWSVMAKTDGTLIDDNGREYYALYWDESIKHKEKFETGFYVKSEDSIILYYSTVDTHSWQSAPFLWHRDEDRLSSNRILAQNFPDLCHICAGQCNRFQINTTNKSTVTNCCN